MSVILSAAKELVLDVLFPRFCIGCNREGFDFCEDCLQNLRPHTKVRRDGFEALDCVVTLAPYGDPVVRELIQTWKYNRVTSLEEPLAIFIRRGAENLRPLFNADLVVPVPLHWYKERERGFNQARVTADIIGKVLGCSVAEVVTRVRKTESQSKLPHGSAERKKNIVNAFAVASGADIIGKRFLLVDDVVTSGHTMDACARVLKRSGATSVSGFAIARG